MSESDGTDVVMDRFERALANGDAATIEDCLQGVDKSHHGEILPQLIEIELKYKTPSDWERLEQEYKERFGSKLDVVAVIDRVRRERNEEDTEAEARSGPGGSAKYSLDDTVELGERVSGETLPPIVIPDYEIVSQLGRGGMGVVLRARQKSLDRDCAIKMILNRQLADERDVQRFEREAKIAAGLNHPGIVQVFDFGEYGGTPYFSMEYVAGSDLKDYSRKVDLSPRDAAALLKEIAEAVAYAHGNGTLHRDLKPSNVMIDQSNRPKITDFGLARRDSDSQLTRTHAVAGTPSYMAPEQARGDTKQIDQRSDVYALGAILYELLTGQPPFKEETVSATLNRVCNAIPVAPLRLNSRVDRDLNTICMKCLEKEADRRYATASDFAQDLERYLQQKPIMARPVGVLGRVARWRRRNPALAMGIVLAILVVVAGVWFGVHQRSRSQSDLAYQAALGERQQGNWKKTLALCDEALVYAADPVKVRLLKIQALDALNRIGDSRKELQQLTSEAIEGPERAQILFLLGDSKVLEGDSEAAEKLLRQALEANLNEADAAYVRGVLAENSAVAVENFKKALDLDPYHHRAWLNYSLLLVMLGDAEARPTLQSLRVLYPDDPTFPVLLAIAETFHGNDNLAQKLIADLQGKLDPLQLSMIERLRATLVGLRSVPEIWDTGAEADPIVTVLQMTLESGIISSQQADAEGIQVNLPFYIGQPLRQMQIHIQPTPGAPPVDVAEIVQSTLVRIVESHDEKLLTFTLACAFFAQGKFQDAEKYYLLARDRSSLIPDLDPEIEYALAYTRFVLAALHEQPEKKPLGIENVRQRIKMKPLRPNQANQIVSVLNKLEEKQLAEDVLRNCWNGHPDNQTISKQLIEQTLLNRNYGSARDLIKTYEESWPEDETIATWKAKIQSASSENNDAAAQDAKESPKAP